MPPVKADPEAQLRLLELQELDTALDRLAHRRRALPELTEIGSMTARADQLRDAVVAADTEAGDLAREQSKAEADVDQVRRRTERDQARLDSGQVSSPRELENLQSEIASLARRQSDLEDIVLEIMERREEAESGRDRSAHERDELSEGLAEAERRRDKALEEIDAEVTSTRDRRAAITAELPEDLLRLYERIREQRDGVGAAPLQGGRCGGCRLSLNTVEVQRIRSAPADEVVRCEECRRILVRTQEPGL